MVSGRDTPDSICAGSTTIAAESVFTPTESSAIWDDIFSESPPLWTGHVYRMRSFHPAERMFEIILNQDVDRRTPNSKFASFYAHMHQSENLWREFEQHLGYESYHTFAQLIQMTSETRYAGDYYLLRPVQRNSDMEFYIIGLEIYEEFSFSAALNSMVQKVLWPASKFMSKETKYRTTFFHAQFVGGRYEVSRVRNTIGWQTFDSLTAKCTS